MTDHAFVAGVIAGSFIAATVIIGIIAIMRPRRDWGPIEWEEHDYQPPVVTTRVLIKERDYTL